MFSYSNGVLWLTYSGRSRAFTVPVPGFLPNPHGSVHLVAMGKRPALRALRSRQPQVQACKLPSPIQRRNSVTDTAVRESVL